MKNRTGFILIVGVVAWIAYSARAQQCDGPVTRPGGTSGSCFCSQTSTTTVPSSANCNGPVVVINVYTSCGGNTTLTCDTISGAIGTSNVCVWSWTDVNGYTAACNDWATCNLLYPGTCGSPPNVCAYDECNPGTPSDVTGNIYSDSSGVCPISRIRSAPLTEQIAFLLSLSPST